MSQSTILAISVFFHLTATVVWVGGLLLTVLLVWPEVRRALQHSSELYQLLHRLRLRFTPLGNLSLAVLIVTGLVQMSLNPNYDGLMQFNNSWSRVILFKHIALLGMIASGAVLQLWVFPALERASLLIERGKDRDSTDEYERLRRQEVRLTWLNAGLGLAVLAFSAWAGAL
jgi:uncharacterized membrane protein